METIEVDKVSNEGGVLYGQNAENIDASGTALDLSKRSYPENHCDKVVPASDTVTEGGNKQIDTTEEVSASVGLKMKEEPSSFGEVSRQSQGVSNDVKKPTPNDTPLENTAKNSDVPKEKSETSVVAVTSDLEAANEIKGTTNNKSPEVSNTDNPENCKMVSDSIPCHQGTKGVEEECHDLTAKGPIESMESDQPSGPTSERNASAVPVGAGTSLDSMRPSHEGDQIDGETLAFVEDRSCMNSTTDKDKPSPTVLGYRSQGANGTRASGDSSETDSSDDESGPEELDESDHDGAKGKNNKKQQRSHEQETEEQEVLRTKGELGLSDLPQIDELQITIGEEVVMQTIGSVSSIIGVLVMVQANKDTPALNEDTVLFLEGKRILGQVFETLGPVVQPFYAVRFNEPGEIKDKAVSVGSPVFYAPQLEEYTHYVFLEQLRRMKGSDASWEHNNEPPAKFLEFSDDEEERRAKAKKRGKDRAPQPRADEPDDQGDRSKGPPKWGRGRPRHGFADSSPHTGRQHRVPAPVQSWPPSHGHFRPRGQGQGQRGSRRGHTHMANHNSGPRSGPSHSGPFPRQTYVVPDSGPRSGPSHTGPFPGQTYVVPDSYSQMEPHQTLGGPSHNGPPQERAQFGCAPPWRPRFDSSDMQGGQRVPPWRQGPTPGAGFLGNTRPQSGASFWAQNQPRPPPQQVQHIDAYNPQAEQGQSMPQHGFMGQQPPMLQQQGDFQGMGNSGMSGPPPFGNHNQRPPNDNQPFQRQKPMDSRLIANSTFGQQRVENTGMMPPQGLSNYNQPPGDAHTLPQGPGNAPLFQQRVAQSDSMPPGRFAQRHDDEANEWWMNGN